MTGTGKWHVTKDIDPQAPPARKEGRFNFQGFCRLYPTASPINVVPRTHLDGDPPAFLDEIPAHLGLIESAPNREVHK